MCGGTIWKVEAEWLTVAIYSLYFIGWSILLCSTMLINFWDLFGLRQIYLRLRNRPYTALDLSKPFLYKVVRHPLYLGFFIAVWASPVMTVSHLLFSLLMTAYIFKGIVLEERDLVADFGDRYIEYRKKVPKLFPVRFYV